jgi:UPF0042 nucleotide-binding protein
MILVVSFAYNNGIPKDFLGCIIDARVFENPKASPRMLRQNGLSKEYQAMFFSRPHNKDALLEAISFARNQVEKNDETVIAVGCQLGQFRSVAVAEKIAADLEKRGHEVETVHSTMEVLTLL